VVSLGIFSLVPPTEPCALRSTQPLKVSTRDFSWGKGGRCVWLTTYHPCSAEMSRKSGTLTYPEPLGPPRPVAGHLYFLLFTYVVSSKTRQIPKYVPYIFSVHVSSHFVQYCGGSQYFRHHGPIKVSLILWTPSPNYLNLQDTETQITANLKLKY